MGINIIELRIISGPDDEVPVDELRKYLVENIPKNSTLRVNNLQTVPSDEGNHDLISEDFYLYVQAKLSSEDYKRLGLQENDVENISYADLYRLGKPIPKGGGGVLTQFLIDTFNSDAPVTIALITAVTTVVKQLLEIYFSRNDNRSLTIKHGEDEISISGYSKGDTENMVDEFFSEIRKKQLME